MKPYTREIMASCDRPIENGVFQFGCYRNAFKEINLLGAKAPYKLPGRFIKDLQLREWQAFQISNADYFIMMALYNAKKLSLAQFIVYEIKTGNKYRYEKKVLPWQINIPSSLENATANYVSKNFKIEVKHHLPTHQLDIQVNIQKYKDQPDIQANFKGLHDTANYQPTVVCLPFSEKRGMYSHKCLMPMSGQLTIGNTMIDFQKKDSQLILDDHKGYYPFPTRYDWLTGMQRLDDGTLLGFNLTNNQVINPEKFNENCLWYNGTMHPLPPVQFDRPNGYQKPWTIKDQYGMVDLVFTPVVHNAVDVNLLLFRSKYEGPYGYINGWLKDSDGTRVPIDRMFGMGEDFYLRI